MKLTSLTLALVALCALSAQAQEHTDETVLLLRTATDRGTYHYAEVIEQHGKIVVADVGYIDFDEAKAYREMWIGGGVVLDTRRVTVVAEGLIDKAFGSASRSAVYFQPWFLGRVRVAPKVDAEVVYFPYVPLNDAGRAQHVLERAKLEYDFKHARIGGGYGAYKFGDDPWHHKPFVSATLKAGAVGNFEFWLQRLPGENLVGHDVTVQVRYAKVFRR